ncbi:excalibur calcium-binding domain-containing protein [Bacillus canaveralius]|uniref:excalibur calcium-binding domain-containing protein n=1 Tax=Bacillus canaveralius TaxID=1403243 RepID=UPI000F79CE34|nr:excalibur calcium-binding domain-containing protein [Bacillus canaveralius]RSK47933.1 hypothetical protein EJA13_17830 [Bacillus canaveralius]
MGWLFFGIALVSIVAILINGYADDSEPVDTNPYSFKSSDHDCGDFATQEDAQLFYEASGGPDEDPHDLDRDGDGMACDWNP